MFPIGDTSIAPRWYTAYVAYTFIVINIIIFLYQSTLGATGLNEFIMHYGSIPAELSSGKDLFTIITSMFLHGGWMHLIGNMLFLWVFGDNIEYRMGHGKFLLFYVAWWVAATIAHVLTNTWSTIPSVGASGAIAAVMGAYYLMYSHSRITMITPNLRTFQVGAGQFLVYRIGTQFLSGVWSLASTADTGGVAWRAHIGGFVAWVMVGVVYGKSKKPKIMQHNHPYNRDW